MITGADVKNGSLSGADIQSRSIALSDLTLHARVSLRGQQGPTGPIGVKGSTGATGAPGPVAGGIPGSQGDPGAAGAKGDPGAGGAKGAPGAAGAKGVSGYEVRTWRYSKDAANSDMGPGYVGVGGGAIATVACSPDKVAVGGGYWFTSAGDNGFNSQALHDGSGVIASFPGRMDWSTNTVKPDNNSGWIVQVNDKVNLADMTMYVICVNAN